MDNELAQRKAAEVEAKKNEKNKNRQERLEKRKKASEAGGGRLQKVKELMGKMANTAAGADRLVANAWIGGIESVMSKTDGISAEISAQQKLAAEKVAALLDKADEKNDARVQKFARQDYQIEMTQGTRKRVEEGIKEQKDRIKKIKEELKKTKEALDKENKKIEEINNKYKKKADKIENTTFKSDTAKDLMLEALNDERRAESIPFWDKRNEATTAASMMEQGIESIQRIITELQQQFVNHTELAGELFDEDHAGHERNHGKLGKLRDFFKKRGFQDSQEEGN